MSTPLDQQQQQQPPPVPVNQQANTARSGHGSVGPVIAVLAVITILGVIAGMIGRLCSGRRILGHGQYDVEGWLERKCSSCIDGRIDSHPARASGSAELPTTAVPAEEAAAAVAGGGVQEIKEEPEQEQAQDKQHGHGHGSNGS